VIGTGSSGIQSIPIIAEQAAVLTVFQRTPNFSIPAHNGPIPEAKLAAIEGRSQEYREEARWSRGGVPGPIAEEGALQVVEEERLARFEQVWDVGELFAIIGAFNDLLVNAEANETLAEFIRDKIRSIVTDPETADALCPTDHPFGTKRPCLDTGYYQTYNLPHVRLVDVRKDPIVSITESGIDTESQSLDFDAIVFATGFDAMTGAIVAVDIEGQDGMSLAEKWADGPKTYLGLTTVGFPNFFTVTGPGSPSVLSNMVVSIEQHVDWICDCVAYLGREGLDSIEPTELAEGAWVQHVSDTGDLTLYPRANSWYMGSNVPGKPRVFLPYVGGVGPYRQACDEVAEQDYLGFVLSGSGQRRCNDGIIRPLQPDVAMLLDMMAQLELPPIETLPVDAARDFVLAMAAERPPGPEVGELVDGRLPGAAGDLDYRLYRPASSGPHPIVAYFHGGGWVLGGHDSDDPFCRDLCVRSDAIVVSVDYRHAPEHRFPAAADDAFAAVRWIAANAERLGGVPGQLAVCGWSAGANVAAVAARLARDAGGPGIVGQVLVTPVTDCDLDRPSYRENGEGYVLTRALMEWFWDHYADPADRADPKASPLRAADLSGLPPALVVTSEFDPLRDEGAAYAEAMRAAGVQVRHLSCRGHIHTSLTAVDMIPTSAEPRAEMAAALRAQFGAPIPA
jgi:acetyl esterase/lipase